MVTTEAKKAAREVEKSESIDRMARFGLASRGFIWVLLGLLALNIAMGERSRADKQGAFAAIKDQPLGSALLGLLALGFAAYAIWRLAQAIAGHRESSKTLAKWAKRAASLGRAVLYGSLAVSTVRFLLTESGGDETRPITARALSQPGGTWLVALVGLGIITSGSVMVVRGVRAKFDKKLKPIKGRLHAVVRVVATVGLVGRGLVWVLIGWFLVEAARTFDPKKAKGLDATLKSLTAEPYGQGLLAVAAISLIAFGLWSFAEARWRRI